MGRVRDPQTTRNTILNAGFEEIFFNGFQASSVNNILKKTQLTKGAFFHHFKTKLLLGYAVVDETLTEFTQQIWIDPFQETEDPIIAFEEMFKGRMAMYQEAPVILGCPLNNLAQEMSPIDEGFRERIQKVFDFWIDGFSIGLSNGQNNGFISKQIDNRLMGFTLVGLIEGFFSLAKSSQDMGTLEKGLQSLKSFLNTLRP